MKIRMAAGLIGLAALLPAPAFAQSSVVIGVPDDISQYGVSIGYAYNQPDHATADSEAMDHCRNGDDSISDQVRDLCHVETRFDGRCLAVSMDPRAGTHGFGWAVLDTLAQAELAALANCRVTAREEREHCVITARRCDGRAR